MTYTERLAEQNIREYDSRLRNLDEQPVDGRLRSSILSSPQSSDTNDNFRHSRTQGVTYLQELRIQSLDNWQREEIAMAGPMGIWDAVAQQLEKLVEKFEH